MSTTRKRARNKAMDIVQCISRGSHEARLVWIDRAVAEAKPHIYTIIEPPSESIEDVEPPTESEAR